MANLKKSQEKTNEGAPINAGFLAVIIPIAMAMLLWLLANLFGLTASHHLVAHNVVYFQLAILFSSANVILLTFVLYRYINVYFMAKSSFTLGLIVLIIAMLAHSISANPLFYSALGFGSMNGPFGFIPLIFTFLAAVMLIYLANQ